MKILLEKDLPLQRDTAIAIGMFDGVHVGHKALIEDIRRYQELVSTVFTFDTKPALADHIDTESEKRSILAALGVECYYSQQFSTEFASMPPEQFLSFLKDSFCVRHITVGFNFRFGKNAAGDIAFLEKNAQRYDYTLHVIPEICVDGHKVSSTAIRRELVAGELETARELLGHFYFIDGRIEGGNRIGSAIGFPTANITTDKLLPSFGVYATIAKTSDHLYRSVSNVGTKPTIKQDARANVETFILDFDQDIYGKDIRVFFVRKQRDEMRFQDLDALRAQITQDSINAARTLENLDIYKPFIMW